MAGQVFPTDCYVRTLVPLLDTVNYEDNNYSSQERVENLRYSYSEAAKHFSQPLQRQVLKVGPKRLEAVLSTIIAMEFYCWTKASREIMAALSIHYTHTLLLDDSDGDPYLEMTIFYEVLLRQAAKTPLVAFIFQGCWIEEYKFHGFPGPHESPIFLRRLNGLGHAVGASIFPREQFGGQALFTEVMSAIAQMENWMVFVKDMMSFYKRFDDERDQTSPVNIYCHTEGIDLDQGLSSRA